MSNKKTTKQFIEEAKNIHGDLYDYSETKYRGRFEPINIECKIHGMFNVSSACNHIKNKVGCSLCKRFEKGLEKIEKYYNLDKYYFEDISKYEGNKQTVHIRVVCKFHGICKEGLLRDFTTGSIKNLCEDCLKEDVKNKKLNKLRKVRVYKNKLSDTTIKERCVKLLGENISFEPMNYINSETKFMLRCTKHDFNFNVLLKKIGTGKYGCRYCKKEQRDFRNKEEFLEKVKEKFENKYDYFLVDYINMNTKIKINCPLHGIFTQAPAQHLLRTFGCPSCGAENSCGYSRKDYIKKCNERCPILYLVYFSLGDEEFYKIGITVNSINRRFKGYRSPYDHKLIESIQGEAGYIFDLEKKIQRELKDYSYTPSMYMEGHTECFKLDEVVLSTFKNLK